MPKMPSVTGEVAQTLIESKWSFTQEERYSPQAKGIAFTEAQN